MYIECNGKLIIIIIIIIIIVIIIIIIIIIIITAQDILSTWPHGVCHHPAPSVIDDEVGTPASLVRRVFMQQNKTVDIEHAVVATDLNKTSGHTLREVSSKRNGGAYRTGTDWLFCSNNTSVCANLPMLECSAATTQVSVPIYRC